MDDILRELGEADHHRGTPGPKCSVQRVLDQIRADRGDQTADQLATKLDDANVNPLNIAQTLARHGYHLAAHTVRRHRRRRSGEGCTCP